jgi:hypothetical protein
MINKKIDSCLYYLNNILHTDDINKKWVNSKNYYEWYFSYGYQFQPKTILEFGVRYGYSLYSMYMGSIDAGQTVRTVVGVDMELEVENSNEYAYNKLSKLLPDVKFKLIKKDTRDVSISDFRDLGIFKFDMIHIDAIHEEEIEKEFNIVWPLLKKNGILIIDDVSSAYSRGTIARSERRILDRLIGERISSGEIEQFIYVNSYTGHYLVKKTNAII